MKTTKISIFFDPDRRGGAIDTILEAGPDVDVFYERHAATLRLQGPKIDLRIENVVGFSVTHVEVPN